MKLYKQFIAFLMTIFVLLLSYNLCTAQTISGKTTTNIKTSIRYYINEATAVFWSDAELLAYINDAVINIVTLSGCSEAMEQHSIVAGQTEYPLSGDYINVKDVFYTSRTGVTDFKGLLRGNRPKAGHATSGTFVNPVYYYEFNGMIGLYPFEDTASGSTIYVYLNAKPSSMTSGATVYVPAFLDRAVVYYATAQALYKQRQFNSGNLFMAQYYYDIKFYIDNIMNKPEDRLDQLRRGVR